MKKHIQWVKSLSLIPSGMMICALVGLSLVQGSAFSEAASEDSPDIAYGDWIDGRLDVGIDLEHADGDSDVELEQYLRLNIDPPKHERLHIRGALWMIEDLDGHGSDNSVLRDLNDASSSSIQARLFTLYLDIDDVWGDSTLRIGRQRVTEGVAYNRMDGVFFKKRLQHWNWYIGGGVRASVYDDTHEDGVVVAGVSATLPTRTRIALDFFYGEDHRDSTDVVSTVPVQAWQGTAYPRRVRRQVDSQSLSLTIAHPFNYRHHFFSRYTWHDEDSDELQLAFTGAFSDKDIVYDLSYRRRLNVLRDRTNDLTGFYRILGEMEEYEDFLASMHIPLHERVSLSLEGQIHNADNDAPNTGNRDYNRYGVVLSVDELCAGVDTQVALERWDVEGGEETWSLTGELSKDWDRLEATFGVDYAVYEDRLQRYRPDLLGLPGVSPFGVAVVELREDIWTVFTRLDYEIADNKSVWVELSCEEDEGPDTPYWRLEAMYSLQF
jgi:hypothetical protein